MITQLKQNLSYIIVSLVCITLGVLAVVFRTQDEPKSGKVSCIEVCAPHPVWNTFPHSCTCVEYVVRDRR